MAISTTQNVSATRNTSAAQSTSTAQKTLGKDDFLKLFTSQLKYQDPLNPMDSTAFTAQLAQFSQLEQLYNMNDNFSNLLGYMKSLNGSVAAGFIGKTVTTQDGTSGKVTGIDYAGSDMNLVLDNGTSVPFGSVTQIN
jgi:flagellar basal-body rod modification protein FlgD